MTDLYLRFDTRDAAIEALDPLGMVEDGQLVQGGHQYALWEVGAIPTRDGWHVNIRQVDPEFDLSSLEPYRVYPTYPVSVWA